jgi:hypothetical protein
MADEKPSSPALAILRAGAGLARQSIGPVIASPTTIYERRSPMPETEETRWLIEMSGKEIIQNKRNESKGQGQTHGSGTQQVTAGKAGKPVTVHGTAFLAFDAAAEITVKKISGQWRYDSGKIVRSCVSDSGQKYDPANFYKVKGVKPTGDGQVKGFAGKRINGRVSSGESVQLIWPMPQGWNLPAVMVRLDVDGHEEQVCFESTHFFDQASDYKLQLKDGWSGRFDKKFAGAADWASVQHQFRVKQLA